MDVLRLAEILARRKLARAAAQTLSASQQEIERRRLTDELLISQRADQAKASLSLGVTVSGRPLRLSITDAMASSIICGATGSGKTKAAEIFLREILSLSAARPCGIGVIDCTGDLVNAALE